MSVIKKLQELDFLWETEDPFLFCAHHQDAYPKGNKNQGPSVSLRGRSLGQDFDTQQDFRMYHGLEVPGFPEHPHRGFETVTVALEGVVDHFDSLGTSGRYGNGDIQWMTAGKGMQHAEMFPLVDQDQPNPLHLFQIWLNLPAKDKFVTPNYKMIWHEALKRVALDKVTMTLIAGSYKGIKAVAPPDASWAADESHHVNIWLIDMEEGAELILTSPSATVHRNLYIYKGTMMSFNGERVALPKRVSLVNQTITLRNEGLPASILLLEGEPINEPVSQYGPFVMNTRAEIQQAFADFQETKFGGWPWKRPDPVHPIDQQRMARYADGTLDQPHEG